jgi:hypothetical protein
VPTTPPVPSAAERPKKMRFGRSQAMTCAPSTRCKRVRQKMSASSRGQLLEAQKMCGALCDGSHSLQPPLHYGASARSVTEEPARVSARLQMERAAIDCIRRRSQFQAAPRQGRTRPRPAEGPVLQRRRASIRFARGATGQCSWRGPVKSSVRGRAVGAYCRVFATRFV